MKSISEALFDSVNGRKAALIVAAGLIATGCTEQDKQEQETPTPESTQVVEFHEIRKVTANIGKLSVLVAVTENGQPAIYDLGFECTDERNLLESGEYVTDLMVNDHLRQSRVLIEENPAICHGDLKLTADEAQTAVNLYEPYVN